MQDLADPGVILLRAGRPVLLVPDTVAPLQLRRVVVAWKDTRECRRAVRDALPFLQRAKEVLLVGIGEGEAESNAKKLFPTSQSTFSAIESPRCTTSGGKHGDRSLANSCISFRMRRQI